MLEGLELAGLENINLDFEDARRGMLNFTRAVNPDYDPNWHHRRLCDRLDDFYAGKIKRLMVFMPPQHGKSELTSRNFPAYVLGKDPDRKVAVCSYSADLAESLNRDVQKIMEKPEYAAIFPDSKLPTSNNGGVHVRNTQRFDVVGRKGFLKAVGVGGSLTGTPSDLAIIDDPHKDMAEAQSPIVQERVWEWYNNVLCTRLHNDSGILLIQTRWDENDLAGRLLKKMEESQGEENAEVWTIVCLPAIKENDDDPEDPRKIGEALWPAKHNLSRLLKQKRQDLRGFQHLYQQNPMPVQAGGEAYSSFNPGVNVRKNEYNHELPLHVTFDFNSRPYMSCGIWQVEKIALPNGTRYRANMIDEICLKPPKSNTKSVCAEIRRRFPNHGMGIYVYGDPNGFKEDTRSESGYNDYTIILEELKHYNAKLRVHPKAPPVKKRIEFMNALFAGGYDDLEITIGENCYRAIEDYQYVKEDVDGTKLKQKVRDPITGVQAERWGHMSDNGEYFLCVAFVNKFQKFLNGGRVSTIVVGQRVARNRY